MDVKTEQNVIGNVTASYSTLSIKSIVKDFERSLKDLQDLDKDLISKSELETMKEKLNKLEEENASLKTDLEATRKLKDENKSLTNDFINHLKLTQKLRNENEKLKADFEATERDRMVYYNQYHQNGKEVQELKTEVERLKNKNQALEDENEYLKETMAVQNTNDHQNEKLSDISSSSIAPALPINDSESDFDEDINDFLNKDIRPELAACEENKEIEGQPEAKRPRLELAGTDSDIEKKWKCILCKTLRFKTLDEVRSHTKTSHPKRKYFCSTCPYATDQLTNIRKHRKRHERNEKKYKSSESAVLCSLCDVTFEDMKKLTFHKNRYH